MKKNLLYFEILTAVIAVATVFWKSDLGIAAVVILLGGALLYYLLSMAQKKNFAFYDDFVVFVAQYTCCRHSVYDTALSRRKDDGICVNGFGCARVYLLRNPHSKTQGRRSFFVGRKRRVGRKTEHSFTVQEN